MTVIRISAVLVALLLLCSCLKQEAAGMKSQETLMEAVCKGVEERNITGIMQLGYWGNVPENVKGKLHEHISRWFDFYKDPTCEVRKMSEKEREPIKAHGKNYVWNMAPAGFIVIKGNDPEYGSSDLPFGIHKGRYYIAARYPEDDS